MCPQTIRPSNNKERRKKEKFINTKLHLAFLHSEILMQSTTSYLLLLKAKDTKTKKFTQSYFLHSALIVGLDETDS